ncbi:hypothetical protein RIR_e2135_A0A2N1N4R7_9GLOM [Rhizophagus irregularis DAOM 181602=DAOM 197198]|nr:hypothetical protein RIR_e2135_A0A2N1N4R7_9GLOM [Rhizophagus irregularis DAOM 181602=DAOM 197198]
MPNAVIFTSFIYLFEDSCTLLALIKEFRKRIRCAQGWTGWSIEMHARKERTLIS